MVSSVKPRPNHYETLGLKPTASSDEIARAFAREVSVSRPRAFGGVTQVSIAYETLRDPIKRRAYDALIGFTPKPEPKHVPPPGERRFGGTDRGDPVKRPVGSAPPLRTPETKWRPRTEVASERTLGSFIAESLREPVEPGHGLGLPPQQERLPQGRAQPIPESPIPDFLAVPREIGASSVIETGARPIEWKRLDLALETGDHPIEWKRLGLAAGGLVLAVGLLGALANLSGGDAEESLQAEPDVTVTLPVATPPPNRTVPPPAPDAVEARPAAPEFTSAAAPPVEPAPAPPQPAVEETQLAEPSSSAGSRTGESSAEGASAQTAIQSPPAQAVAANLPLPTSVIARTIERIGYACGEVASATATGTPGVYKVTCTSGQSYQATPIRGRYRFRRWGSR